jgi:hypothetical protein
VSESPETTPLSDPWTIIHDNGFSWDDVNALASICAHYGLDIVKEDAARATVPAGQDIVAAAQRVVDAKPVRWNDRPADSFIRAVLDLLYALAARLGEENDRG